MRPSINIITYNYGYHAFNSIKQIISLADHKGFVFSLRKGKGEVYLHVCLLPYETIMPQVLSEQTMSVNPEMKHSPLVPRLLS